MRHAALAALLVLAPPALAQSDGDSRPLMPFLDEWSERTEDMMRELMDEIGPEMERMMTDIVPQLQELSELLGGMVHYEMPEILPNGDIIIRRKQDAPPLPDDFLNDNGAIDL